MPAAGWLAHRLLSRVPRRVLCALYGRSARLAVQADADRRARDEARDALRVEAEAARLELDREMERAEKQGLLLSDSEGSDPEEQVGGQTAS